MSDVAPEANRTRMYVLVGIALAALVALVFLVILPLLGGGDDPEDTGDADVVIDADTEPTPSPTEDFELADPDEVEGEPPVETFEVFNARDPFQQLVQAGGTGSGTGGAVQPPPAGDDGTTTTPPTTGGTTTPPTTGGTGGTTLPPPTGGTGTDGTGGTDTGGTGGTGGTGDGTGTGGDTGGTGDGTGTGGDTGGGTGGGGGSAEVGGTTVTLVDVFTDDDGERKATVTVNGTGYTVAEGDTFARRFRLLDISGRCSTMLFGDSRFTLCEGERIRK